MPYDKCPDDCPGCKTMREEKVGKYLVQRLMLVGFPDRMMVNEKDAKELRDYLSTGKPTSIIPS